MILAGRRINDSMGPHIARKAIQQMIHAGRNIKGARVNVLGLTFKEDVPRHPQLQGGRHPRASCASSASRRYVHDPMASAEDALHEYGVKLRSWDELPAADALILAVPHKRYLEMPPSSCMQKIVRGGCVIDVKSVLDAQALRREGLRVWRL